MRARAIATPSGCFRSSTIDCLLRYIEAPYSDTPSTWAPKLRPGSPSRDSIFTTSAPKSASRRAHTGPAMVLDNSTTRCPRKGPLRALASCCVIWPSILNS